VPRFATDDEVEVFSRMRRAIAVHQSRNLLRTRYAEAEHVIEHLGLRLPSGRVIEQTPLHWPSKAIEVFSSRLAPAFFSMRESSSLLIDLESVWVDSAVEFAEQLAIRAALRHGPAFLFSSKGDPDKGEPEIIVSPQSALTATCEVDRRTRRVTSALELLEGREANLYLPGVTLHVSSQANGRLVVLDDYPAPQRVMCSPYIHDATIEKPFGSSRITRSIMGFTDAAVRTFMRQEVSAEWYAAPRERLLGVGPEAFDDEPGWVKSMIGGTDVLPDVHPDDDPDIPDNLRRAEIEYAPQMTMQPFSDQFRLIASQFSGASSIPLQYLGIVQDSNPTSAPAIEAQDIDLVRAVKDQHPSFNYGRRTLAINVLTLLHGDVDPADLRTLASRWHDPRVRSVQEQSTFVAAQVAAGNFQAGTRATLDLLPITPEEAASHADANRMAAGSSLVGQLLAAGAGDSGSDPADLKARADALGVLIRAGVDPKIAGERVGLPGLTFTGTPVAVRTAGEDA
jgi:hypothetical protein